MEVMNVFFSDQNLSRLTSVLGNNLGIDRTDQRGVKYCSKMLHEKIMPNIWEKYKKSVAKHPPKKVVDYLNKKSLELSNDVFTNKIQKKEKSMGDISMEREKEISGSRSNKFVQHPHSSRLQGENNNPKKKIMSSDFSSGLSNFANFSALDGNVGENAFITADGSMGRNFQTNINQNDYYDAGKMKADAQEDIERKMAEQMEERKMSYGGNPNQNQNQNMRYMQNANEKREEINFCFNGGDTRMKAMNSKANGQVKESDNMYDGYSGMGMGIYDGLSDGSNYETFGNMNNMGNNIDMRNMINTKTVDVNNNMKMYNHMDYGGMNGVNNINIDQSKQLDEMMNMMQSFMTMMTSNMNTMNAINSVNASNSNYDKLDDNLYIKKSSEYKKSIASKLGMNPQNLLSLTSKEIENLIETKKKSMTISNKKAESSSDSDETSSSESSSEEEKNNKNNNNKKVENKKVQPQKKTGKKVTIVDEPDDKIIKVKYCVDEIEKDSQYYNDYLFDFAEISQTKNHVNKNNMITAIKEINLKNINMKIVPEINETNCNFNVICNGNEDIDISLTPEDYTLEEIIEGINENYKNEGCKIFLSEKDGIITINNNEEFIFDNTIENSLGSYFGFSKKKYTGASKYVSEKKHAFNKKVYLYIVNVNKNSPFAVINQDGSYQQLIKKLDTKLDLEYLVIQFKTCEKNNNDRDEDLANLGTHKHKIEFELVI